MECVEGFFRVVHIDYRIQKDIKREVGFLNPIDLLGQYLEV